MQTNKFLWAACLLGLLMLSCKGEDGRDGQDGLDANFEVFNMTAMDASWVPSSDTQGLNTLYQASFSVPELTEYICDNGLVTCYHVYSDGVQAPLPVVRWFEDQDGNRWSEVYDFEYQPGTLTVFFTVSDFYYVGSPGDQQFRLVLSWAGEKNR